MTLRLSTLALVLLSALPAAAEPLQMPQRCLRPRGASGGARSAAVGAGSPVTPPAATAICSENTTLDGFVHKILSSEPFLIIIAVLKS